SRRNSCSRRCQRSISPGRMSFIPLTARNCMTFPRPCEHLPPAEASGPALMLGTRGRVKGMRRVRSAVLKPTAGMRAAAVDLGKVRVGLAVSDELGLIAHPRPHLDGRNPGQVVEELAKLADEEGIERFLVGLPRTLGGSEGPPARRARKF